MDELKPQESEALDIIESLLDVADMKNTGPMYADNPPRSGMCRIPEEDAAKLRQYIAARRTTPENKALTLEELRKMNGNWVWLIDKKFPSYNGWYKVESDSEVTLRGIDNDYYQSAFTHGIAKAYTCKLEGSEKP